MSEKSPAYQWYPQDYLASGKVAFMTLEDEGCYNRLLNYCWLEHGLPNDMTALASLCKNVADFEARIWPKLKPCFYLDENGKWQNQRQDKERSKQKSNSSAKSDNANKRWEMERKRQEKNERKRIKRKELKIQDANALRLQCKDDAGHRMQKQSLSSSSSFSSSSSDIKENPKEKSDPFLKFDSNQIRKLKFAIADARGFGYSSEATEIAYRELITKLQAENRKREILDPFNYAIASARNLGKPFREIKISTPEEALKDVGIPEQYRKELEAAGILKPKESAP